jgi:hypothetical protein
MRERTEEVGGRLRVVPRSGGGTVVEAKFPLAGVNMDDGKREAVIGERRELVPNLGAQ